MVVCAERFIRQLADCGTGNMFYVYVIQSEITGKIYIGYTSNLTQRLEAHNQKFKTKVNSYTRLNKGPWKLVYQENYESKKEAMMREKQLKSYKGREFIKSVIY